MGRTACTEPQCLYKGAHHLFYMLESVQLIEKQIFCYITPHRLVSSYRRLGRV